MNVPVTLVLSRHDDVPDAEVHILEGGHFALDEATDEIASLVRDFLARLDGHKG